MNFEIIPAIDLRGGRVVRLRQGDYACETAYPGDPVELAERYAASGAAWLHVVDLDGARSGTLANLDVVTRIARVPGLRVQCGGGVRSGDDLQRLYDAGVARAVVGSVAVEQPPLTLDWLARFGVDRVTLALDARECDGTWLLQVKGWTQASGVPLQTLVERYARAGARHVLCTDIGSDGVLGGCNIGLYHNLHDWGPGLAVQASGGAASLEDLRAVRATGAQGVVLGRALLEGRFTLAEALAC